MPAYGAKVQLATPSDEFEELDKADKKYVHQVLGTFLYYGRAVDGTMLTALSANASSQAKPMRLTMHKIKLFLDYVATNPDAVLTYRASNMVRAVHSDDSCLSEPKARS